MDRQFREMYAGVFDFASARIEAGPHGERIRILRATALKTGAFSIGRVYVERFRHPGRPDADRDETVVQTFAVQVLPKGEARTEVERRTVLGVGDQLELRLVMEERTSRVRSFTWRAPEAAIPWKPKADSVDCQRQAGDAEETSFLPQPKGTFASCWEDHAPDIMHVTFTMKAVAPGDLPTLNARVVPAGAALVVTPSSWSGEAFVGRRSLGKREWSWEAPMVLRVGDSFRREESRGTEDSR